VLSTRRNFNRKTDRRKKSLGFYEDEKASGSSDGDQGRGGQTRLGKKGKGIIEDVNFMKKAYSGTRHPGKGEHKKGSRGEP